MKDDNYIVLRFKDGRKFKYPEKPHFEHECSGIWSVDSDTGFPLFICITAGRYLPIVAIKEIVNEEGGAKR